MDSVADPSLIPDGADLAKVGGGGGLGAILALILARLFARSDADSAADKAASQKILDRLDGIAKAQQDFGNQIAVLSDRAQRTVTDVEGVRLLQGEHSKAQALQEARIIRLEERLDQLLDRVERCETTGRTPVPFRGPMP